MGQLAGAGDGKRTCRIGITAGSRDPEGVAWRSRGHGHKRRVELPAASPGLGPRPFASPPPRKMVVEMRASWTVAPSASQTLGSTLELCWSLFPPKDCPALSQSQTGRIFGIAHPDIRCCLASVIWGFHSRMPFQHLGPVLCRADSFHSYAKLAFFAGQLPSGTKWPVPLPLEAVLHQGIHIVCGFHRRWNDVSLFARDQKGALKLEAS